MKLLLDIYWTVVVPDLSGSAADWVMVLIGIVTVIYLIRTFSLQSRLIKDNSQLIRIAFTDLKLRHRPEFVLEDRGRHKGLEGKPFHLHHLIHKSGIYYNVEFTWLIGENQDKLWTPIAREFKGFKVSFPPDFLKAAGACDFIEITYDGEPNVKYKQIIKSNGLELSLGDPIEIESKT